MKIWAISDSHTHHRDYKVPVVDTVLFCGDESNRRDQYLNEAEFYDWYEWFEDLPIQNKLYIPGNHSTYVYHNEKRVRELFFASNIHWMHNEELVLDGLKFYGCGISPTFGDWVYMSSRTKMNRYWEQIPDDVDVLLTHAPPRGILDVSERRDHAFDLAGCSALRKRVDKLKQLKLHVFGHIHDDEDIVNAGLLYRNGVYYGNCAGVTDRRFDRGITFNGNIIEL